MATSSLNTSTTTVSSTPRPMAPSAITSQQYQNVSFYKSFRNISSYIQAGSLSIGTVATSAPDGTPATFNQGALGTLLIRVAAAGGAAALGIPNEWVSGGGQTTIAHGLNTIPTGYWVVRKSQSCDVYDGDSAWDSTNIYLHTTNSASDCILMVF